jgi:hypothetical protein
MCLYFLLCDECFEVKCSDGNFPNDLEIKVLYHRPTYTSLIHPITLNVPQISTHGGFLTYHNHFLVSALWGLARLGRGFLWRSSRRGNKQSCLTPSERPSRRFLSPPLYSYLYSRQQMAQAIAFSQRIAFDGDPMIESHRHTLYQSTYPSHATRAIPHTRVRRGVFWSSLPSPSLVTRKWRHAE